MTVKSKFIIEKCGECPMYGGIGGGHGLCRIDRSLSLSHHLAPPACCPIYEGPIVIVKRGEDYVEKMAELLFDASAFVEAMKWLCTEPTTFRPDQNVLAMKLRRRWRELERLADSGRANEEGVKSFRERAAELRLMLLNIGQPI